jgi:hypothetical protein
VQKLWYAETVKKVEEDGSIGRDPERSRMTGRSVPVQRDKPTLQWLSTTLQGNNLSRRKLRLCWQLQRGTVGQKSI